VRTRITTTREDLQKERDALKVAKEIQVELEKRIEGLENDNNVNEVDVDVDVEDGDDGTRDRQQRRKEQRKLSEMTTSTKEFRKQSGTLIRQLAKFSKERLALMITVEEMGGPVVGTELDVEKLEEMADVYRNDNNLATGRGKGKGKGRKVREKGQKRIDEIWGKGRNGNPDADDEDGDGDRMDVDVVNPVDAAGNEILDLIEVCILFFPCPSTTLLSCYLSCGIFELSFFYMDFFFRFFSCKGKCKTNDIQHMDKIDIIKPIHRPFFQRIYCSASRLCYCTVSRPVVRGYFTS